MDLWRAAATAVHGPMMLRKEFCFEEICRRRCNLKEESKYKVIQVRNYIKSLTLRLCLDPAKSCKIGTVANYITFRLFVVNIILPWGN